MKTVFLDRDGVINKDFGYVHTWDRFEFTNGAIEALKLFTELNYAIIVVTNQSGVARGMYTESDVQKLHFKLKSYLRKYDVYLKDIYYCPHHIDSKKQKYRVACDCRKPQPGMLKQAIIDHCCDINSSVMVGDKFSDVKAGLNAGIRRNFLIDNEKNSSISNLFTRVNSLMDVARHLV